MAVIKEIVAQQGRSFMQKKKFPDTVFTLGFFLHFFLHIKTGKTRE